MLKRVCVSLVGIPLLFVILICSNKYIIDIIVTLLALVSMHEYMKCCSEKFKPISWIGYLTTLLIAFIHVIPMEYVFNYLGIAIISIVAILFLHIIITEMKINLVDISITLLGILYIVGFYIFIPILFGYEKNGTLIGKFYIWYLFLCTWGSDVFAFLIGCKFGKHKFSKISPKKSIEGCVAGVMAGVILSLIATAVFNEIFYMQFNYLTIFMVALVLTIIGQIGDFSASCIKRYIGIKDFSNLLPGHGGLIDRFDSVIFAAPFAYYLLTMLI